MSAPEPRSVIAHAMPRGRHGAGGEHPLQIRERRMEVVQVTAGRERVDECAQAVTAAIGIRLRGPNRAIHHGELTAVWIQPRTWLLLQPWCGEGALLRKLAPGLDGLCALVDQTGGKAVLRIAGKHARDALAKGCRVDLHPREFKPGSAAVTPIAHVNVVLAQADGAPSFDLILPASFAESFAEWLLLSAGEFGYVID